MYSSDKRFNLKIQNKEHLSKESGELLRIYKQDCTNKQTATAALLNCEIVFYYSVM